MRVLTFILVLSLIFNSGFSLRAAEDPAPAPPPGDATGGGNADIAEIRSGLKSDFRMIVFAGLGGAVLGLSTLSFVEKPSKEIKRIYIGFAVGAIIASIFVLYKATSKSMTGAGISTLTNPPDSYIEDYYDDEYYEDEDGNGEEEYDEDFYSIENSFYLASIGKNGFKLNFPVFDFNVDEEKGLAVRANIFRMTF